MTIEVQVYQLKQQNLQLRRQIIALAATIDALAIDRPEGRYSMALEGDTTLSLARKLQLVCDLAEYDGG